MNVLSVFRRGWRFFACAALGFFWLRADAAERLDGIVLLISDGTSMELLTAARDYAKGPAGRLALDEFPRTAFVHTYSASDYVTDSSAAATAMARGVKARNRAVGVGAEPGQRERPSILDLAKAAGWSTAILTTDAVTGGTPSPFLVEHHERNERGIIAGKLLDQLGKRADIVLGGGAMNFRDLSGDPRVVYAAGERDAARRNQARLAGLPVAAFDSWEAFRDFLPKDDRPVLGTFYPGQFPFQVDDPGTLRLRDMVAKTVDLLRAKNRPFFIMAEAEMPDVACHLNMAKRAIGEVLEFDATIDWLRKNLGPHVLILATTDHNNGGFTINGPPMPRRLKGEELLGVDPVTGANYLTWASGPGADRAAAGDVKPTDVLYRQPALIPAKASMHSGGDVWLLADGPGSEKVRGFLDNTDIFRLMADAIQGAKPAP